MITAIYLDDAYNLCSHILSLDARWKSELKLIPTNVYFNNLKFYDSCFEYDLPTNPTYIKTSLEFILRGNETKNICYKIEYGLDGNYESYILRGSKDLLYELDIFLLKKFYFGLNGHGVDFFHLHVIFYSPIAFSKSLKLFEELNVHGWGYDNIISLSVQNTSKIYLETAKFLSKILLRNNLL